MNPSQKLPGAKIMTITPALAEEWLGHNSHNRAIRQRQVDHLTNIIKRGEWKLNGDAIRFSAEGTLIDGQHRLWAIVMSELPVETLVIRGLDAEVQETIDIGTKRNLADALKLRGEKDANCLAATLCYYWRMENGYVRNSGMRPTIAQAIHLLEAEPMIRDAIVNTTQVRKRFRLSPAMTAAVWYEYTAIDNDAAQDFFDRLNKGSDLSEHDPILLLRRWLERQLTSGVGTRASIIVTHAMMTKAWNYWRKGQELEMLAWRPTGKNGEPFPEAI